MSALKENTDQLGIEPCIDPTAEVRDTRFGVYCEVGARTKIAECRFGDYAYVMNDADLIHTDVGRFANIAAFTRINPGQHPVDRASLHHFQYRSRQYGLGEDDPDFFAWRRSFPVSLGPDTWIGHGAVIMGGVHVGVGAVVGANAVVTRDVPDYTIVAGVPARALRPRFAEDIQAVLKRIAWWNWSHEQLGAALPDFRELSVEDFCLKYDPAI
jgi:phosphonate metabolism protein (transferase hexapeptide repeat family)